MHPKFYFFFVSGVNQGNPEIGCLSSRFPSLTLEGKISPQIFCKQGSGVVGQGGVGVIT